MKTKRTCLCADLKQTVLQSARAHQVGTAPVQAAAAITTVEIAVQVPALSFPTGCALHVVASQKIKQQLVLRRWSSSPQNAPPEYNIWRWPYWLRPAKVGFVTGLWRPLLQTFVAEPPCSRQRAPCGNRLLKVMMWREPEARDVSQSLITSGVEGSHDRRPLADTPKGKHSPRESVSREQSYDVAVF